MVVKDIFLPKTNSVSQKSGYVVFMDKQNNLYIKDKQHNLYIHKIFLAPTIQFSTPYQGIYIS